MSDITTINGNDRIKDSRAVINANFQALNDDKVEQADFENALPAIEGNPGEIPYVEEGTIISSPKFVWNNEDNTLTIYPDPEDLDKYFQLQGGEGISQIRSNSNDLFISTDQILLLFGVSAQIGATNGDVKLQNSIGLLDSDATKGFVQIPASDGMPTGVPDDIDSGLRQMVYDATNNKLYFYNGGWKPFSPVSAMVFMGRGNGLTGIADDAIYADSNDADDDETVIGNFMTGDHTIKNLVIDVTGNTVDDDDIVFTLFKNGSPTGITITVAAMTDGTFQDTTHTVDVEATDRITIEAVAGGSTGDYIFAFSYEVI